MYQVTFLNQKSMHKISTLIYLVEIVTELPSMYIYTVCIQIWSEVGTWIISSTFFLKKTVSIKGAMHFKYSKWSSSYVTKDNAEVYKR